MQQKKSKNRPEQRRGAKPQRGRPNRQRDSPRQSLGRLARWKICGAGETLQQQATSSDMKPQAGAAYTVRQFVAGNNFLTHTGLSGASIVAPDTTGDPIDLNFSIGDLPQVTSFLAIFDQYRLEKVILRVIYRGPQVTILNSASPNTLLPFLHLVTDFDDSTSLASVSAAEEYSSHHYLRPGDSLELEFVPSATRALYAAGAFSGYETVRSNELWVDFANTAVPYYGVKGWMEPLTTSSTEQVVWDVNADYIVSFANTR